MTSTKQMIVQAFSKAFNKYFYNELVVGKLAHSELKQSINKLEEELFAKNQEKFQSRVVPVAQHSEANIGLFGY